MSKDTETQTVILFLDAKQAIDISEVISNGDGELTDAGYESLVAEYFELWSDTAIKVGEKLGYNVRVTPFQGRATTTPVAIPIPQFDGVTVEAVIRDDTDTKVGYSDIKALYDAEVQV